MAACVVLTGPLWPALTSAARLRAANLPDYLPLPGGLALTCTALHLPVFDMFSSLRNLECIAAVPYFVPF